MMGNSFKLARVAFFSGVLGCGSSIGGQLDGVMDAGSPPDAVATADAGVGNTPGAADAGEPGAPTLTSLVAGEDQSAIVGQAVAVRPRILVTDSEGVPTPGVEVNFNVLAGGGSVDQPTQRTGADGTAAVGAWRMGPTPGRNELEGEVPGLAPVSFVATGLPDSRGSMVVVEGNNQSAQVGTAVLVAPAVRVATDSDDPSPDREVTFTAVSGGGRVEGPVVRTNAQGVAAVGAWVLGPNPGPQVLEASVEGLPSVTFDANAVSNEDPVLTQQTWITTVNSPWDLAFLPDGTLLITEKGGRILAADAGQQTTRVLAEVGDVDDASQSGLLGIAVDPDFSTNRYIYTYVSAEEGGTTRNNIRRWKFSADGMSLERDRDILTGMTYDSGGAHSGGRIEFGPDGFLYVTTGDVRRPTVPQDMSEMGGKVLRITRDGMPAPGNPSWGSGARPEIFFVGIRNAQGLSFRPRTGQPYICEHGPNENDEVTPIQGGANGGWNPNDGNGNYNGYTGANMTETPATLRAALGLSADPQVISPVYRTQASIGMSDCTFLSGPQWKAWDGALLVGFLVGRQALVLQLDAAGTALQSAPIAVLNSGDRLRAMAQGPDGALYVAINGGPIWRVTPQ